MRYLLCENANQLQHVSSGQLLSEGRFIHPRRKLDTWVLIICTKGKLHIAQDDRRYTLAENQYLILFAGHEHFGFMESGEGLSYYWCHFRIPEDRYSIANNSALAMIFDTKTVDFDAPFLLNKMNYDGGRGDSNITEGHFSQYYILPEYGDLSANGRAVLIFRQLLDLARKDCYSAMLPNCALSLLCLEISQEFVESHFQRHSRELKPKMEKIIEWIRVNYNLRFTLEELARIFTYNPDYLSTAFRRYTGMPLMRYISMVRIANAKKLLLNTGGSVKEIAGQVGFDDEKTFMKRFKQLEDITPSTYRNAFNRTKIVKE